MIHGSPNLRILGAQSFLPSMFGSTELTKGLSLFLLQKRSCSKYSKRCPLDSWGPSGDLAGPDPREFSPWLASSLFDSSGWSEWATYRDPCFSLRWGVFSCVHHVGEKIGGGGGGGGIESLQRNTILDETARPSDLENELLIHSSLVL